MSEHSLHSSYREKLIEHLLIGELLKFSWLSKDFTLEIAKPEVDNSGYDIIAESNGVIRHIQLKAAFVGSATASQKIHIALAKKPSGCVVLVYFSNETLELGPYYFYGAALGVSLAKSGSPENRETHEGRCWWRKSGKAQYSNVEQRPVRKAEYGK